MNSDNYSYLPAAVKVPDIKWPDEKKCINHAILLGVGPVDYESYRLS